jgi:hypothetical protein
MGPCRRLVPRSLESPYRLPLKTASSTHAPKIAGSSPVGHIPRKPRFYFGNGTSSRAYYARILPLETALEIASAKVAPPKPALEALFEALFVALLIALSEAVTVEDGTASEEAAHAGVPEEATGVVGASKHGHKPAAAMLPSIPFASGLPKEACAGNMDTVGLRPLPVAIRLESRTRQAIEVGL